MHHKRGFDSNVNPLIFHNFPFDLATLNLGWEWGGDGRNRETRAQLK